MTNAQLNNTAIVRIKCGSNLGTAFFVSNTLLLTAQHVVENHNLDNENIYIISDDGKSYPLSLKYCSTKSDGDFCILESDGINREFYLECLKMPIQKSDKYHFFGYPYTILGQTVGVDIEVEIYNTLSKINALQGFDSAAIISGGLMPIQFTGFSGSPIMNKESKVIGVVTHKLDGCIGFISVDAIYEILEKNGINLTTRQKIKHHTSIV